MALEHSQGGLQASSGRLGGGLAPLLRLGALQEGQAAVVGGVLPVPCPHRLHPAPALWVVVMWQEEHYRSPSRGGEVGEGLCQREPIFPAALTPRGLA